MSKLHPLRTTQSFIATQSSEYALKLRTVWWIIIRWGRITSKCSGFDLLNWKSGRRNTAVLKLQISTAVEPLCKLRGLGHNVRQENLINRYPSEVFLLVKAAIHYSMYLHHLYSLLLFLCFRGRNGRQVYIPVTMQNRSSIKPQELRRFIFSTSIQTHTSPV